MVVFCKGMASTCRLVQMALVVMLLHGKRYKPTRTMHYLIVALSLTIQTFWPVLGYTTLQHLQQIRREGQLYLRDLMTLQHLGLMEFFKEKRSFQPPLSG